MNCRPACDVPNDQSPPADRHEPDPEDAAVLRIAEAVRPDRLAIAAAELARHRDIRKRVGHRRPRDVDSHFDEVIHVDRRLRLVEDNFRRLLPRREIVRARCAGHATEQTIQDPPDSPIVHVSVTYFVVRVEVS